MTQLVLTSKAFHRLVIDTKPECTEMNPGYFFADENDEEEPFGRSEQVIAKSACDRCPIKLECFANAINNREQYGVWGASVPEQRIAYWRKVDLN